MYDACHQFYMNVDVAITATAVADYRPKNVAQQKIKKNDSSFYYRVRKKQKIF